jgi:type IV pilus assembly protein PilC
MPSFQYSARNLRGELQRGVSLAGTAEALAAELRGRGLLVLGIDPVVRQSRVWAVLSANPLAWLPPTRIDVEVGLLQLATMLHSGLSLLMALRTVGEQARRPRAAAMWRTMAECIERGSTLSEALERNTKRFPPYVVQLVRVGENSGELDRMLTRAAEHLEQSRNLRLMLMNALTYPVIVLTLAVGVSSFMILKVIPKIQVFLAASGRSLPPMTRRLLDVSDWLRAYMPWLGLWALALAVAVCALHRWPPGRRAMDGLWLRLPVVGSVLRLAETAVFARGMGILLESGVALLDSLRTVENLVGNRAVAGRVAEARIAVTRGETLASGLTGKREFLPIVSRMVAVGEATGTLGRTLSDIARFHEAQLLVTIRRMSILIEPVMILVVGGMVGFVYISFFVALFSLATGVR